MNILIIGCGQIGSNLCNKLSDMGHDISVISDRQEDFANLSSEFNGYTTTGVPIDQDVLRRAGIENCDALAAVTGDDNVNLMVAQLAKEFFHVENAYARVNDPMKNEMFAKMNIKTICPTNISVATLSSALSESSVSSQINFENHSMIVTYNEIEKRMIGKRISELQFHENESLVAIEHENKTLNLVLLTNYEITKGDKLICIKFVD